VNWEDSELSDSENTGVDGCIVAFGRANRSVEGLTGISEGQAWGCGWGISLTCEVTEVKDQP